MTEYTQQWEQWVGSTARPVERAKHRARVIRRDGRKWITVPDEIDGKKVTVEMPDNAPTGHCRHGRHDSSARCAIQVRPARFVCRCGCPCHNDPHRAGRLF